MTKYKIFIIGKELKKIRFLAANIKLRGYDPYLFRNGWDALEQFNAQLRCYDNIGKHYEGKPHVRFVRGGGNPTALLCCGNTLFKGHAQYGAAIFQLMT